MKTTIEEILYVQSPALFLLAILLILCYFARRANHHARAIMDLVLGILAIAGGIALYYLGMLNKFFTIKDFWQVRTAGLVGLAIVAVAALILLLRAGKRSLERRRDERAASRQETARQKELEEVRQKAYASGMADAMTAETQTGVPEHPEDAASAIPQQALPQEAAPSDVPQGDGPKA